MWCARLVIVFATALSSSAFAADPRDRLAGQYQSAVQRGAPDAEVSQILQKIVAESQSMGVQDGTYAAALDALTKIARRTGDHSSCAKWAEEAAAAYEKLGDLKAAATAQETAAAAHAALGQFSEAEKRYLISIETLKAAPFRPGLNKDTFVELAEAQLGMMYLEVLQLEKAKTIFAAHAERDDDPAPLRKVSRLANLAKLHFLEQDWEAFDDRTAELAKFLSETKLSDRQSASPRRQLALLRADSFLVRQKYDQAVATAKAGLAISSNFQLLKATQDLEHRLLIDRLAAATAASGNTDNAKKLDRQYVERISSGTAGGRQLNVDSLRNRAQELADYDNVLHAEYLVRRVLDDIKVRSDYSSPATRKDLELLARCVREQGRLREAEFYENRAAELPSK
jgi:hypothetical protein